MQKQKTVLVIEDEKSLRDAIVDILHSKNFLTLEAKNGKEGVDLALRKHPDLILLDLIMPTMDGMTTFQKIRQNAWGKKVSIIILTNLSATSRQLVDSALLHQSTQYLIKSDCKIYDIAAKIENILGTQINSYEKKR